MKLAGYRPRAAEQLIQPDASIAFFLCSFPALILCAVRSARVSSGVRWLSVFWNNATCS